jgi:flagellar basal-body rod protein FlgG
VQFDELYTDLQQGAMKESGNDFDMALDGKGFFTVQTPMGERYTRNGSFHLGKEGYLETKEGYPVLGENGPLKVKANNFQVDKAGNVWINAAYADESLVARDRNVWDDTIMLDTLKIVEFDKDRHLKKQGSNLYASTDESGAAMMMDLQTRPRVVQGFTEASNVDPVLEMVHMIEVNRAYEANQKVIQSGDSMLGTLINQVARVG